MTLGLLGNKIGMTQIFNEDGNIIPITIIKTGPCIVTAIKTQSKEGYGAIQLGYEKIHKKYLTQPKFGHLNKSNIHALKYLKEFRTNKPETFEVGQNISTEIFKTGQCVNVSGISIGKGFSGLQKRHKFTIGPMTHGSKNHREPGSIGMGTTPGRVLPGKRMAGQLGNKKVTIKKLEIIHITANLLILKGSVPGKPNNLLTIKSLE